MEKNNEKTKKLISDKAKIRLSCIGDTISRP